MTLDTLAHQKNHADVMPESNNPHHPTTSTPEIAIAVRDVSKMYPLYADPQDRLKQSVWYMLPKFLRGKPREFYREFWALHDISFEINKGETIGLIGRNGSGKSTLLQIIAGTLAPSHGEVLVSGQVAALLELGSGFNPDFTGRENVYLNGAILSLSQNEIDQIFDDIAAFADIGQFIDQPVKLYSSGMIVRLAFAVQAFVPKEVLIVDEALSVGDEAFQRKCMVALEKFRDNGGTVLLVSHDLQTVVRHCERCLLLADGELLVDDASKPVTDLYQRLMYSNAAEVKAIVNTLREYGLEYALNYSKGQLKQPKIQDEKAASKDNGRSAAQVGPLDWFDPNMPETAEVTYGDGSVEIVDYGIYNQAGEQVNVLVVGRRYEFVYRIQFYRDAYQVHFGMMLKTVDGLDIAGVASYREQIHFDHIPASSMIEATFSLKFNIVPGTYFLNAGVGGRVDDEHTYLHRRVDLCMIRVLPCDSRESYGLAYLEPRFTYVLKQ